MLRPKEVVHLSVDAFNRHDTDAIVSLYHDDATNHQVANDPVVGVERILFQRGYWDQLSFLKQHNLPVE